MEIKTVELRELKAQFSAYLKQVKDGNILVITERGEPIARIEPMPESLDEKLRQLSDVATSSFVAEPSSRSVKQGESR